MISLDSSRLRELERILIKLVEVLSDLDIASEVISPLPLENYVSILQYPSKEPSGSAILQEVRAHAYLLYEESSSDCSAQ